MFWDEIPMVYYAIINVVRDMLEQTMNPSYINIFQKETFFQELRQCSLSNTCACNRSGEVYVYRKYKGNNILEFFSKSTRTHFYFQNEIEKKRSDYKTLIS